MQTKHKISSLTHLCLAATRLKLISMAMKDTPINSSCQLHTRQQGRE
jgi:hypothetical protein